MNPVEQMADAFKPLAEAAHKVSESAVVLTMDGNQWRATRPDFINLQESLAGFGDTQAEAVQKLLQAWRGEKSTAFEVARAAERMLENLQFDRRPYKPADYRDQRAAASTAYAIADKRYERAFAAVQALDNWLRARELLGIP